MVQMLIICQHVQEMLTMLKVAVKTRTSLEYAVFFRAPSIVDMSCRSCTRYFTSATLSCEPHFLGTSTAMPPCLITQHLQESSYLRFGLSISYSFSDWYN